MTGCRTKTGYRDQIAAKLALAEIQHRDSSKRGKSETRVYRCPHCKKWHLTSQPKRGLSQG